jgi:hypothetical protein
MRELLEAVGITEFASKGWIHRFLKRYSLVSRRITGSGRALDPNASEIVWDYIIDVNDYIIEKGKVLIYLSFISDGIKKG